jgi:ABC-type sugar transport system ATPase subunit
MDALGVSLPSVHKSVRDLSGGQRQVVALARAVMSARRMIIMDEPTAALGAKQSQIVLDTISRAKQNGLTILLVSHDLPRVLDAADRIAVMRLGQLATIVPADSMTVPKLVSLMLGELERDQATSSANAS